jgi:short-subunit dehydrogenase
MFVYHFFSLILIMDFNNKNVVLTGASSGIGYQMAKDLAREGANLVLLARRKNILDDLAAELKKTNSDQKIIALYCDITSRESVNNAFKSAKKEFEQINIIIMNAGASYRMSIEEFNADKIERTINTNLTGTINCLNEVIPEFIKNKKGVIVGISSLAEARGFPKSAAYCSSKAAVSIFLESIRIELKKYNVKVITVKPGFVKHL